jgi:hypothetical protein
MERFDIVYDGNTVSVEEDWQDESSLFIVHLPEEEVYVSMNDEGAWCEDEDKETDRASALGRLIEEYDGR